MKKVKKLFLISLVLLAAGFLIAPMSANASTGDASLTIDVTFVGNYGNGNMTNVVYVGGSPYGTAHVVIPLTENGAPIIDQHTSANVPGLNIERGYGYVILSAYGENNLSSREVIRANFSFSGTIITGAVNEKTNLYEGQGNGSCSVVETDIKKSNPGNDEYTFGGTTGTICSITNTDEDNVRFNYNTNINVCVAHASQKCVDNSVYWFNSCNAQEDLKQTCTANQTCSAGSCINQDIACSSNLDCSSQNGYVGSPYCQNSSTVFQTYRTYTCQNPRTVGSSCIPTDAQQQKTVCGQNQTCSAGACVNQNISCNLNSDCGANVYTGNPYCQNSNVFQNFLTYTCNNPGTANSSCSSNTAPQLKTTCTGNQTCNTSTGSCSDLNNLVVSSYATPNPANVNQQVSFIATATGGTGNYTYSWTGSCTGSGQVCNTVFSQSGTHTVTVTVTSGYQTTTSVATVTINQTCSQRAERRCYNNSVYWYDSCGTKGDLIQYCQYGCSNGYCNNQTCTTHSYQQCAGSYLYWYNSCGVQEGQSQYCQYGCSGNTCNNYNNNYSNLTAITTVKNLTTGSGWSNSVSANPSDVLMFMITLRAQGNQNASNVFVRDILPYGLVYANNLIVSGSNNYNYNYVGDITSGINIGTISNGQTITITYQAQVAPAGNFSYGTSTLTDNVSVTGLNCGTPSISNASVSVTRTAVYGATSISTGLTNNFLADSFLLPLLLALLGLWMFRSGIFGIEKWADTRKTAIVSYRAQKHLNTKIAKIREQEKN